MPISCHFRDCTALLVTSLTHVSGAIASVQTFYLSVSGRMYALTLASKVQALALDLMVVALVLTLRFWR